jgi:hypothetical protein
MEKRRITLNDGRYLIYYSFEDEDNPEVQQPSHEHSPDVRNGDERSEIKQE